jgi:hypothetical protein
VSGRGPGQQQLAGQVVVVIGGSSGIGLSRWWSTPFREWVPSALPFVGGIACHELQDVPAYPASHGCVRQSFTVARWTYNFAAVGCPSR